MNKKLFFPLLLFTCLFFSSCDEWPQVTSAPHQYTYYLINDLNSPVTLYQQFDKKSDATNIIQPQDTFRYSSHAMSSGASDLAELVRPSLEDGYSGSMQWFFTTLSYDGVEYEVNRDQESSFMICANYEGFTDSLHDYFYNYYFHIDEKYIQTIQNAVINK